jgi:hypothetical protein
MLQVVSSPAKLCVDWHSNYPQISVVLDINKLPEGASEAAALLMEITDVPLLGLSRVFSISAPQLASRADGFNITKTYQRATPGALSRQNKPGASDKISDVPGNAAHGRSVALCIVGQIRSASSPRAAIPAAINRNIVQAIAGDADSAVHIFFVLGEQLHDSPSPCPGSDWICSNDDFVARFPSRLIRGVCQKHLMLNRLFLTKLVTFASLMRCCRSGLSTPALSTRGVMATRLTVLWALATRGTYRRSTLDGSIVPI